MDTKEGPAYFLCHYFARIPATTTEDKALAIHLVRVGTGRMPRENANA